LIGSPQVSLAGKKGNRAINGKGRKKTEMARSCPYLVLVGGRKKKGEGLDAVQKCEKLLGKTKTFFSFARKEWGGRGRGRRKKKEKIVFMHIRPPGGGKGKAPLKKNASCI